MSWGWLAGGFVGKGVRYENTHLRLIFGRKAASTPFLIFIVQKSAPPQVHLPGLLAERLRSSGLFWARRVPNPMLRDGWAWL